MAALQRFPFRAMGSPCELLLHGADSAQVQAAADQAMALVGDLERRYSRYRDDSLLAGINRIAARGGSLEVDPETAALLDYADTCHRESGGLFDISSGLLRRAWRFPSPTLPSQAAIQALLERVGWRRLRWQRPRLSFPVPGMELDLGGIGKEYAADRAAQCCRELGIRHGLVNLGGDIRLIGPQPDGAPWRLGIRHPRQAGALLGSLGLTEGALASSGDYVRCLEIDGHRYSHILDPRSGWPVQGLAAVSVIAGTCLVAGSLGTIAMLKGLEGPAWLAGLEVPHLWVDLDGQVGGSLAGRLSGASAHAHESPG